MMIVAEIGRDTAYAISGWSAGSGGVQGVRTVAEAMESYHTAALARSAAKVELSRAATTLLHSEAALTPGDLTRAGTARARARAAASDGSAGEGAS